MHRAPLFNTLQKILHIDEFNFEIFVGIQFGFGDLTTTRAQKHMHPVVL